MEHRAGALTHREPPLIDYLLDTHFGQYDQPIPSARLAQERLAVLLDEAKRCDRVGFDGVLVPDRHGRTETVAPAPLSLLAVLARETEKVELGTFSLVLTLYPPMLVAEEAVFADLLSGGRLKLSVSMGYHPAYFRQMGVEGKHRVSRFEEAVDILKLAFAGERFSYSGKRFQLDDVVLTPPPVRESGIPLWFGGESPEMITRTALHADAWATGQSPLDRDVWLRRVDSYRSQAAAAGRPSRVVMMRDGFVASSFDEAARIAGDALVGEQIFMLRQNKHRNKVFPKPFESESDFTIENLRDHFVMGSPDDCIESATRYFDDYDVDELVLRFRFPLGPSPAAVADCIDQFGAEVLPHIRRST